MITVKKEFVLKKSQLAKKFRVENNFLDLAPLIQASGYTPRRLGDLAPAHRNERKQKDTAEAVIKYIQISDIDVDLGRIRTFRRFKGKDAPNNARRLMKHGDILVSTRRPTRGAVVAVPKEFDGEICTVFFTTLRVKNWDEVDPAFLALYLRTSLGRFQFQSMITETAYPVIGDEDVENMIVLLPPIDVQRRIAGEYERSVQTFFDQLNAAHGAITAARQSLEDLVLGVEAEKLSVPTFGVGVEEVVEEADENGNGNGDEAD